MKNTEVKSIKFTEEMGGSKIILFCKVYVYLGLTSMVYDHMPIFFQI